MGAYIITQEDLNNFKDQILEGVKELLKSQQNYKTKKWLKSPEVRQLLSISPGTLQNLRINGTLPYSKVGGVIYYDYDEILKVIEENRIHNKF